MRLINFNAIYILWLREMKRTWRAKSRIVATILMPLFFLAFLGFGLRQASIPGIPENINYSMFLIPGIIGMAMLFSSTMAGFSFLWDKEFGFLKEIMVTPVSRLSIVIGRVAGGATISMFQGIIILFISYVFGFRIPSIISLILTLILMLIISFTFIGLGLIFASRMKDMQGFSLIVNFVIFPIFFLSGAIYPLDAMPSFIKFLTYIDPLTYGVDGLRGILLGISSFPLILDFGVMLSVCIVFLVIGSYLFEKSEVS